MTSRACIRCDCPMICFAGEKRVVCARCREARLVRAKANAKAKKVLLLDRRKTERTCKDCKQQFACPDGRPLRQCASCRAAKKRAKNQIYYSANKERELAKSKQRYVSKSALMRQKAKAYYEAHREQVLAKKRERYYAELNGISLKLH